MSAQLLIRRFFLVLTITACYLLLTTPIHAQEGKTCKIETDPDFNEKIDQCPLTLDQYCQNGETLAGTGGSCNPGTKKCSYNYQKITNNPLRCVGDQPFKKAPTITCNPDEPESDTCRGTPQYCVGDKTFQCGTGSCNASLRVCEFSSCPEVQDNPLGCKNGQATASGGKGGGAGNKIEPVSKDNYKAEQHMDFFWAKLFNHTIPCFSESQSLDGKPCLFDVVSQDRFGMIKSVPYLADRVPGGGTLGISQGIVLAMTTTPPIHPVEYLADLGKSFGVTPAYAQVGGSGQNVLNPILEIWKLMRNLAYLIMIVVFLVIGLMIIFRQKINPQTTISVQAALPSLVIGLILITFSYFLASLIVDLAFVGAQVAGTILEAAHIVNFGTTQTVLSQHNVITIFSSFMSSVSIGQVNGTAVSVFNILNQGIIAAIVRTVSFLVACGIGAQFGLLLIPINPIVGASVALAGCVGAGAAGALGTGQIIGGILYAVLIIALLFAMFRLIMSLIANYISIIVLTIMSPLIFLGASIPGRQGGISNWINSMLCNTLAFPAIFLVLLFAAYLIGPGAVPQLGIITGSTFATNAALPVLGGLPQQLIRLLLAYGVLLGSPQVPAIICNVFKVDPRLGQQFTGAARTNLQQGAGVGTQLFTGVGGGVGRAVTGWARGRGTGPGRGSGP